jgi:hypothetical protein
MRRLVAVALLGLLCGPSAAEELNYQVQRAVFRAPGTNRGLAVDAGHFWVGQSGGWARCYDRNGQPDPN